MCKLFWWKVDEDGLPPYDDFVWVKRNGKIALAYFNGEKFQDPYSVGDSEGLSEEWYDNVTEWSELEVPES